MLNGPLVGKLIAMALPLAFISILQQFFNAADVAVVGRFASETAIAAVGANTPVVNMFVNFVVGIATGGNVTLGMLIGQGEFKKLHRAVQTLFTLSLIGSVLVIVIGELCAGAILNLIGVPDNVMEQALLYLRIYLVAVGISVVYNFASAILRSKGDTRRPLYCLTICGILNLLLNLLLVIVFRLDVAGVAIATLISNLLCAGAVLVLLVREDGPMHLEITRLCLAREPLLFTLKVGLPTGIQGSLFALSNVVLQTGINSFGSDCIAGNTAALNFEYISYFASNAFGQTCTTFTSQNFGASKPDRCRRTLLLCLLMGCGSSFVLSLLFLGLQGFWLGLFTASAPVLAYGSIRMLMVVLPEFLTGFYTIPSSSMQGMGIPLPSTVIMISGSVILRVIWINTIFAYFHTIQSLLAVYVVSWVLMILAMNTAYFLLGTKALRRLHEPAGLE